MTEPEVIYDFGANVGKNLPYYLLKARKVVAVEANPVLCADIVSRFAEEVRQGRLVVENYAVGPENAPACRFFVNKNESARSQMMPPPPDQEHVFEEIVVPGTTAPDLVKKHGAPLYIKIDVEYSDCELLRQLFAASIRPPFVSTEVHSLEAFFLLAREGRYRRFKLVNGVTVPHEFKNWPVWSEGKQVTVDFLKHSAGPFGHDLPGRWIGPGSMFERLVRENIGWKDIHATSDESLEVLGWRDWLAMLGGRVADKLR